jgi:molybdopterin adenylyltransferase
MDDLGGQAVADAVTQDDWHIHARAVVPDEIAHIATVLRQWSDERELDIILTTGGTGLGPRDVTPEATNTVSDRSIPGIAEAMRAEGLHSTPHAMLSRALAVARGQTLIVNLPGSPTGAREGVMVARPIFEHAIQILRGGRH